jgi:hypothetical protein
MANDAKQIPVRDLYDFLQRVRKRPGMYLRDKSLEDLDARCHGYSLALNAHAIQEFGTDFNELFSSYLFERFG